MKRTYFLTVVVAFLSVFAALGQTEALAYWGRLTDSMSSGNSGYIISF